MTNVSERSISWKGLHLLNSDRNIGIWDSSFYREKNVFFNEPPPSNCQNQHYQLTNTHANLPHRESGDAKPRMNWETGIDMYKMDD